VLLAETLEAMGVKPDGFYVDATLGGGGFSRGILERLSPSGRLLALDLDPEPLKWASVWARGEGRLVLRRGNFASLPDILRELSLPAADGITADLGLSSRQLMSGERGFSLRTSGPLDMRISPDQSLTAYDLVNGLGQGELADLIYKFGGDRFSRQLASLIAERRKSGPIETTGELAALAVRVYAPRTPGRFRIHPATRLFLALRTAVNGELESLGRFLDASRGCLKEGGRLLIITFQSGEDRLVKNFFRSGAGFKPLWKKSVAPRPEEARQNIRARSARLRGGEAV
jgi:16S rRNA (cytosine1402-N4)-methyltransferase